MLTLLLVSFLPPVHSVCSGLFLCLSTFICISVFTFCTQSFRLFIPGNFLSSGVCSSGYIIYIRGRWREGMVEVRWVRGWRRGRRYPAALLRSLMFSSVWAIDAWHYTVWVFILWPCLSCCLCVSADFVCMCTAFTFFCLIFLPRC